MSCRVRQEEHRLHVDLSLEAREAHTRYVVEYSKKDSRLWNQAHGVISEDRRSPGGLALKTFARSDHANIRACRRLFPHDRPCHLEQLVGQAPDPLLYRSQVP